MSGRRRSAASVPAPVSGVRRSLDRLRERLWFWPVVAAVVAAAAAEALVRFDRVLDDENARPAWVFGGEAGAARDVLSAIASASMTVVGVILSITLAVLALTGQGYSPRTIRRFIRDPLVQAVIAGFVGTFVFAFVALRLVRADQVPGVTVNVAVVLAMGAIGLLIAFFHHMANEIRVERLIDAVWQEARQMITATLPAETDRDDPAEPRGTPAALGRATRSGRVQTIADQRLADVARDTGATIVVVPGPGDFVIEGEVVVRIHGDPAAATEAAAPAVGAIELGVERSMTQDVAFGIDQLGDIALRALSPGINDPTTAEEAILRSADLLCRLADRQLGSRVVEDGRLLVLRSRPSWDDLVGRAFDQVAAEAEAQADAATSLVLIDALGRIVAATDDPARVEALRARVRRVRDGARRAIAEPSELERVEAGAAPLA
jgi:uncharacterized membrane protein